MATTPIRRHGNLEIPAGTHVPDGVYATGVVALGDRSVCEGSIFGERAVVLGKGVRVRGDVQSKGPITIGPGARIDGRVNPTPAAPLPAIRDPRDVEETLAEFTARTVQPAMQVLLDLARQGSDADGNPLGLSPEALDEHLRGIRILLADVYRGGDVESDWKEDEVVEILLRRALPLVVPVSIAMQGPNRALVTLGSPGELRDGAPPEPGWAGPVLVLLDRLGRALHPSFRIAPLVEEGLPDIAGASDHVYAVVTFVR
ncbi:MAG: polymer-forming cytoskeletal protein [Methanobacteriota archaeon]